MKISENIERNKAICIDFVENLSERRYDDALAQMADDIAWWIQGNHAASGYHRGKEALAAGLSQAPKKHNHTYALGHVTAEQDRVAIEMVNDFTLENGKSYKNSYHFLFIVRDGLVAEVREYLDTFNMVDMMA